VGGDAIESMELPGDLRTVHMSSAAACARALDEKLPAGVSSRGCIMPDQLDTNANFGSRAALYHQTMQMSNAAARVLAQGVPLPHGCIMLNLLDPACSSAEHHDPTERDASPFAKDMRRQRSMHIVGRREKPTAARRYSLMTFPLGAGEELRPARAPVYQFGAAHVGTPIAGARLAAAKHTTATKDNAPRIKQQLPEPYSESKKTFARTSVALRARPYSCPATYTNDEDYIVQGLLDSALKDSINARFQQRAGLQGGQTSPQAA